MVIITDANGNIQSPTIPENVYQGSNFANEIVFLAPLPQSNVATITFRLPNGQLLEEQPMTPYTDVPSEYNLSAWRFVLNDEVTQYYGQVTFQIYLYGASGNIWYINAEPKVDVSFSENANFKSNGQNFSSMSADGTDLYYGSTKVYNGLTSNWTDLAYRRVSFNQSFSNNTDALLVWLRANGEEEAPTLITSVAGTFPVLRGVPRIPHSLPSQASWQQICTWLSTINASLAQLQNIVDNNWLESKGILPYDSSFTYSLGSSVFDKNTKTIYTSLQPNNYNKSLSDTDWWGKTVITGTTPAEVEQLIEEHNTSNTAHNDIRNLIAGKQDQLSQAQLDAVNSGIDSTKVAQIATNTGDISTINEKIPAQASSSNQLADKNFVNSSISTNTAYYIGSFVNITALNNYAGTITNNDYAIVTNQELDFVDTTAMNAYDKDLLTNYDYAWVENSTKYDLYRFDIETQTWGIRATAINKGDVQLINAYNRYKYNGSTTEWMWEYTLNTSGFTAVQWEAINSGATATQITKIGTAVLTTTAQDLSGAVNELDSDLGGKENTSNKVTSISSLSTDTEYPSAKCVYDLVAGLQSEITSTNKLSADLVDDTNATNKFVTSAEKTSWNAKQKELTTSSVSSGTINEVIGFNSNGDLVRGSSGGGSSTAILEKFAPAYDENEEYSEDDIVSYNGSFYQCTSQNIVTGSFDPNDWTEINYEEVIEYAMKMLANDLIVEDYNENENYAVGDYALSPGFELVKCISATTGEYNVNDWEATNVATELTAMNTTIRDIDTILQNINNGGGV